MRGRLQRIGVALGLTISLGGTALGLDVSTGGAVVEASRAIQVSVGGFTTCGLAPGGVHCWGDGFSGLTSRNTPGAALTVPNGFAPTAIAGTTTHMCASDADGGAVCWGDDSFGQLGSGNTGFGSGPQMVTALPGPVTDLDVGPGFTCAIVAADPFCWGWQANGRLGNGQDSTPVQADPTPAAINMPLSNLTTLELDAVAIDLGDAGACALLESGDMSCWGTTFLPDRLDASDSIEFSTAAVELAVGADYVCARLANGGVECLGNGSSGQLGNGSNDDQITPVPVSLPNGVSAATIDAGVGHTCIVTTDDDVFCWGENTDGQLGDGTTANSNTPVQVALGAIDAQAISTGGGTSCIVTSDEDVMCWGRGTDGELGNGADASSSTAVVAGRPNPTFIPSVTSPTAATAVDVVLTFDQPTLGTPVLTADLTTTGGSSSTSASNGATTLSITGLTTAGSFSAAANLSSVTGVFGTPSASVAGVELVFAGNAPVPTFGLGDEQISPVGDAPIEFSLTFDQDVTGLTSDDITVGGDAGGDDVSVTGSGQSYVVTVGTVTRSGTVTVSLPAGVVANGGGTRNVASGTASVTVDQTGPIATIDLAVGQDARTRVLPINFAVDFDEPVAGFASDDIELTGTAGATSADVFQIGVASFIVRVNDVDRAGTATLTIADDAAEDQFGNLSTAPVVAADTVEIFDDDAPFITVPEATVMATTDPASPTAVVTFEATAADPTPRISGPDPDIDPDPNGNDGPNGNQDPNGGGIPVGQQFKLRTAEFDSETIVPICSPASGSAFAIGDTVVTCTASDAAGNIGTASFMVTVQDDEDPVISNPGDQVVSLPVGSDGSVDFEEATATDNSGAVTVACTPTSGTGIAVGGTDVTCTATDPSGNTSATSFILTVEQQTAPTTAPPTTPPPTTVPTTTPPATTPPITTPPTTTPTNPIEVELPSTGSTPRSMLALAGLLFVGGAFVVASTRRQRPIA